MRSKEVLQKIHTTTELKKALQEEKVRFWEDARELSGTVIWEKIEGFIQCARCS